MDFFNANSNDGIHLTFYATYDAAYAYALVAIILLMYKWQKFEDTAITLSINNNLEKEI